MGETDYEGMVEELIEQEQYLALSTTDGEKPWVATIEYIYDSGTFYFFSPADTRHARHVADNPTVAVAIWGPDQPEYGPDVTTHLRGVQIRGIVRQLPDDEYPEAVEAAVDALEPPMPPYEAYAIEPRRAFAPVIEDGVNERVRVNLG